MTCATQVVGPPRLLPPLPVDKGIRRTAITFHDEAAWRAFVGHPVLDGLRWQVRNYGYHEVGGMTVYYCNLSRRES